MEGAAKGSRALRAAPWAALALGLATTALLDSSIANALDRRHRDEFDREIARLRGGIADAVRRQVSVVEATAGVVSADPDLDQAGFTRFYERLQRGKDAARLEAVGLSIGRPWSRRGELALEAARRGARGFRLRPEATRAEAYAVVLIGPLDAGNASAPGYDMHAEPVRRAAMGRALQSGRPTMTSVVPLAKDRGRREPSFVFYLPVERPERGLVFAAVHAQGLFGDLFLDDPNAGEVGLRLLSDSGEAAFEHPLGAPVVYRRTRRFDLPEVGAALRAEVTASAEFGTPAAIRPFVVPMGAVLSLLLFLLASNLRRAGEDAARRAAEQTLLAEVGRLTSGRSDADDVLEEIAARTAALLGAVCRIDLLEAGGVQTVNTRQTNDPAYAALERDYPRLQSDPLLGRALETAQTQRSVGYRGIDEGHRARLEAVGVGPVAIVPLSVGDRVLGALTITRRKGRTDFTIETIALVEAIAGRMALAIENERLYRDLERRVEERTRELEASNHELESFCYSVSHDLRTPLRSLDGFGRLLEEDYRDQIDRQGLEYLARIRSATRRMDELITALLTLSRLTRREIVPREVDVTRLVCEAMRDLDPEGRIRLIVDDGLTAQADPRMLAVAFDNLLGNAVKFTARSEEPEIVVGRREGDWLFVRDNGAGFDMAYAAKLFVPFERLHSAREFPGHGIGLATVDRIVRRHGGEVRAAGQLGEGATFSMRFPRGGAKLP